MLAFVHISPWISVPGLIVLGLIIVGYWLRLGRASVPESRCTIRRISLALMMLSLPVLGKGLSFLDPKVEATSYLRTWTVAFILLGLVVISALVDAMNSVRLIQHEQKREMLEAAKSLHEELKKHDEEENS